ncbi:MAG: hypothetical protein KTR24_12590 [Saprospiraceae bacterium]|nr:hypothetical protein [Saprospiraceae bacterium]
MKKQILVMACLILAFVPAIANADALAIAEADFKKPPRPEKLQEEIPERPSEFHVWREGRWKWKKKHQAWTWKEGYWSFDHDYYRWKTYNRFYGRLAFYRPRYLAVPIGRGLYRIVRYR